MSQYYKELADAYIAWNRPWRHPVLQSIEINTEKMVISTPILSYSTCELFMLQIMQLYRRNSFEDIHLHGELCIEIYNGQFPIYRSNHTNCYGHSNKSTHITQIIVCVNMYDGCNPQAIEILVFDRQADVQCISISHAVITINDMSTIGGTVGQ